MKFEFKFDNVQTSNVFSRFEIWRTFKCLVVEREFVEKPLFHDWFHTVCTDSQRMQSNFLSNSAYHTNYSYWMCNL